MTRRAPRLVTRQRIAPPIGVSTSGAIRPTRLPGHPAVAQGREAAAPAVIRGRAPAGTRMAAPERAGVPATPGVLVQLESMEALVPQGSTRGPVVPLGRMQGAPARPERLETVVRLVWRGALARPERLGAVVRLAWRGALAPPEPLEAVVRRARRRLHDSPTSRIAIPTPSRCTRSTRRPASFGTTAT